VNVLQVGPRNSAPRAVYHLATCFQQERYSSSSSSNGVDFGLIFHPPDYPIENEDLPKSIRCCISGYNREDFNYYTRDTGMSICFLGTSAGIPTRHRSTTATLLRLGGSSFLFDAGEGVQRQLAFTRAKPSHIERIFITHLHGDHIFGLPGFLLGLQHSVMMMNNDANSNSKKKKKERGVHVVKIYGPPGLYNYIACNIILSCTKFHSLSIEVYELVGGRVRRLRGGNGIRNPFEHVYPEFNFGFLKRKTVECENGVWNIHDFPKISRQDVLTKHLRSGKRDVRIKAAELDHGAGIATFGFVVEEDEPARNIDADRAKALGVMPKGKKYELLKYGFSVWTEDGTREVRPEEVLKPRTKNARKIAIIGDNRAWTPQMTDIAQNADVLIHEATLTEEDGSVSGATVPSRGSSSYLFFRAHLCFLLCRGATQQRPWQVVFLVASMQRF
jgi:ribonuclease Z